MLLLLQLSVATLAQLLPLLPSLLLLLLLLLLAADRVRLLLSWLLALLLLRLPPAKLRYSWQNPCLLLLLSPLPPCCSCRWVSPACVTTAVVCAAALRCDAVKQLQDVHVCIRRHSTAYHKQQAACFR
jgi:hypothetical protein